MIDYYLPFGSERIEVQGSDRQQAYGNLKEIYRNCSTPEQLVEVGSIRDDKTDGLLEFLSKHRSEVDDG